MTDHPGPEAPVPTLSASSQSRSSSASDTVPVPGPSILRARVEHGPALTALAHRAKRHWGYPEAWIEAWRDDLEIGPRLLDDEEVWMVLAEGPGPTAPGPTAPGADEPLACMALVAIDGPLFGVEHMWVDPAAHGRGLGRRLFAHAAERARERGARELEILSDPNAAGFYRRLGCVDVGERTSPLFGQPRTLPVLRYRL